jgi:hypothetical protein
MGGSVQHHIKFNKDKYEIPDEFFFDLMRQKLKTLNFFKNNLQMEEVFNAATLKFGDDYEGRPSREFFNWRPYNKKGVIISEEHCNKIDGRAIFIHPVNGI